jgi:hypothetical protein
MEVEQCSRNPQEGKKKKRNEKHQTNKKQKIKCQIEDRRLQPLPEK